jgi:imidazole glycerol phosphate synthase subunit HisF
VLCASIFHYGQYRIGEVKDHLAAAGVPIRPPRPRRPAGASPSAA